MQPASGDAGISYGAALLSSLNNKNKLKVSKNHNFYLGSSFEDNEILDSIKKSKQKFEKPKDLLFQAYFQREKLLHGFKANQSLVQEH